MKAKYEHFQTKCNDFVDLATTKCRSQWNGVTAWISTAADLKRDGGHAEGRLKWSPICRLFRSLWFTRWIGAKRWEFWCDQRQHWRRAAGNGWSAGEFGRVSLFIDMHSVSTSRKCKNYWYDVIRKMTPCASCEQLLTFSVVNRQKGLTTSSVTGWHMSTRREFKVPLTSQTNRSPCLRSLQWRKVKIRRLSEKKSSKKSEKIPQRTTRSRRKRWKFTMISW